MAKVTELVREMALPVAEEAGCELWDVEYVREAGTWFLRVYIDKEGGVDILDCEKVSRTLSDLLDEADPIEGSYTLVLRGRGAAPEAAGGLPAVHGKSRDGEALQGSERAEGVRRSAGGV